MRSASLVVVLAFSCVCAARAEDGGLAIDSDVAGAPASYTSVDGAFDAPRGSSVDSAHTGTQSAFVRIGTRGSPDFWSLAGIASASLTRRHLVPFTALDVAIGDLAGSYQLLRMQSGHLGDDAGFAGAIVRNGALMSRAIAVGGRPLSLAYSFVDTYVFGDALHARHYGEVGISVGSATRVSTLSSDVQAGASFIFSPKLKGFNVGMRVKF